jgi:hypothetical protein
LSVELLVVQSHARPFSRIRRIQKLRITKSCVMLALAFVYGAILGTLPSPGCHFDLPVCLPAIRKVGGDRPPQIRASTSHEDPFSSPRDGPPESLSEEEASDVDFDVLSPSRAPVLVSELPRHDDRYVASSRRDGPLDQLDSSSQLRC